ncbi:SAP30L [Cordylochernes scorpioides]|uniref:Cyclin-dependent kinases regulatory subunit n=1 Tax=Cordylochernes scorpioides TaxID=51811 RepID=A0ABY6K6Q7_9ARAC|nr:SAP30L [Cordylochernes scorpioides]
MSGQESQIQYSERYEDDVYEYRHVVLPAEIANLVPKTHLMTETEWRNLGVQQSPNWIHYMLHNPEPHILLFRRKLLKSQQNNQMKRHQEEEGRCCMVEDDIRCHRPANIYTFNKRMHKLLTQRRPKLRLDTQARHNFICENHKNILSLRMKRRTKDSEDDADVGKATLEVDFCQLQINTLRRYRKFYKVPIRPGANKAQLAETLARHFKTIKVNEREAISTFIHMVQTNSSKLDQKAACDNTHL